MRRIMLVVCACALCSLALVASAQATSGKPKIYEWCGSASGCYHPEIWFKSKEWGEGGTVLGPIAKGKKGELILYGATTEGECHTDFYKVPKTKNYSGEEPPGQFASCFVQTVTLTYEG